MTGWEETERLAVEDVQCLSCDLMAPAADIVEHFLHTHHFDLKQWIAQKRLPIEEIIRMLNYLRKTVHVYSITCSN